MAATAGPIASATEAFVTVKVAFDGSNRKFKLSLKDLGASVFPDKISSLLQVPATKPLTLERFSDSSASYITLDPNTPSTYKQLYRAAKAKSKLRIRATAQDATQVATAGDQVKDADPSTETPATFDPPLTTAFYTPLGSKFSIPVVDGTNAQTGQDKKRTISRSEVLERNSIAKEFPRPMRDAPTQIPTSSWQVFCNVCDKPMVNVHFHCSICDDGDYDLCESCVENGKLCPGENHWLIKRFIRNGTVINSTTERIAPKPKPVPQQSKEMPGSFESGIKLESTAPEAEATRTCNCCVRIMPEKLTVTCMDCDDYDICMACHVDNKHGHHPAHTFKPTLPDTRPSAHVSALCAPGRNMKHAAICDGCDKHIAGVRHKCLNCPDWDYCGDCFEGALNSHPEHRFVPVYEPLDVPRASAGMHYGIYCDGPLCKSKTNKRYIQGTRYKCAICHDTDFCANCEAHPTNKHNVTHPLIKFKTQVRNVSVTTVGENKDGQPLSTMGDRHPSATSTPKLAKSSSYANSTVTLPPYSVDDNQEKVKTMSDTQPAVEKLVISNSELDAHFVTDTITDGTTLLPDTIFTQTWTLRNPGPHQWPVGCSVRNVGGDNMLNIDRKHPASVAALAEAQESNLNVAPVIVNDNFSFSITMRSPGREGRHISYWRLKAADGTPFGHKLWCDIEVKKPSQPADVSEVPQSTTQEETLKAQSALQRADNEARHEASQKARQTFLDQFLTSTRIAQADKIAKIQKENSIPNQTEDIANSAMVFPKLDKESPTSSTYAEPEVEPNVAPPTAGHKNPEATKNETSLNGDGEAFEEVQSIDSTDEDDFLTDDEYDILCASDEEASHGVDSKY